MRGNRSAGRDTCSRNAALVLNNPWAIPVCRRSQPSAIKAATVDLTELAEDAHAACIGHLPIPSLVLTPQPLHPGQQQQPEESKSSYVHIDRSTYNENQPSQPADAATGIPNQKQRRGRQHTHVHDLRRVWEVQRVSHSSITAQIREANTCSELLALVQAHENHLNAINLCAALHRTVTLLRQPHVRPMEHRNGNNQLVPLLISGLRSQKSHLQHRAIATVIHSLGALDIRDRELYNEFCLEAERCMSEFTSQGLANMMWAFARSGTRPTEAWMKLFVGSCRIKLHLFSAQDLGLVMWGLTKLNYRLPSDKQTEFMQHAQTLFPRSSPHALSMIAHSLAASHQKPSQEWLSQFAATMLAHPGLRKFTPQGLTVCVWALAQMEYEPSSTFSKRINQHFTPSVLAKFEGIDVATMLYSVCKAGIPLTTSAYHSLLWRLQECMFQLEPSQLANAGMAISHLTISNQLPPPRVKLLLKYLSAVYTKLPLFNSIDVSMLIQGLAHQQHKLPETFLSALQMRVESLAAEFSPQNIALTLWGLQKLGVTPSANLMVEFFHATDRRLSSFKPNELAVMIWALAQANCKPEKAWLEEFLHITYPWLPQFTPQGLSIVILALAKLSVRPTPAWLYSFANAATASLLACTLRDVEGLAQGIQAINEPPDGLQLQKLDDFLATAETARNDLQRKAQTGNQPHDSYSNRDDVPMSSIMARLDASVYNPFDQQHAVDVAHHNNNTIGYGNGSPLFSMASGVSHGQFVSPVSVINMTASTDSLDGHVTTTHGLNGNGVVSTNGAYSHHSIVNGEADSKARYMQSSIDSPSGVVGQQEEQQQLSLDNVQLPGPATLHTNTSLQPTMPAAAPDVRKRTTKQLLRRSRERKANVDAKKQEDAPAHHDEAL